MRQKVFKYLLFVLFLVVFIVTQVSGRMEVTKKKRKSTMVGFEQRGACGCCEKDGVKSMNKAVSILNPFNSRTNVFEAAKSKSYLYAEPVCKGKGASSCDYEKCMQREKTETNMCGTGHFDLSVRTLYNIQDDDESNAYGDPNLYTCCPYGETCSMPKEEHKDFLNKHRDTYKGLNSVDHKVFSGDMFDRDRTYLVTCGYLNRVCCPTRKRTRIQLNGEYIWNQKSACVSNKIEVNHGVNRAELKDVLKIKEIKSERKREYERKMNELNQVYGAALKALYDASLPADWTSSVRFEKVVGNQINPIVLFINGNTGEESNVRPHKDEQTTENEFSVYEDTYGSNQEKCKDHLEWDLFGTNHDVLKREYKALTTNGRAFLEPSDSKCLALDDDVRGGIFSTQEEEEGNPDRCISNCQIHIEGTWASWWVRYNALRTDKDPNMKNQNSKNRWLFMISPEATNSVLEDFKNWVYEQKNENNPELETGQRDRCLAVSRIMMRTSQDGQKQKSSAYKSMPSNTDNAPENRMACYRRLPPPPILSEDTMNGISGSQNEKDKELSLLNANECVQSYKDLEDSKETQMKRHPLPSSSVYKVAEHDNKYACYYRVRENLDTAAECYACTSPNVTPEMANGMLDDDLAKYDVKQINSMGIETGVAFGCYYLPDGELGYRCIENRYNKDTENTVPRSMLDENPEIEGNKDFWKRVPSYKLTAGYSTIGNSKSKRKLGGAIFVKNHCDKYAETTCGIADFKSPSSARKCYDCVELNTDDRWDAVTSLNAQEAVNKGRCAFNPDKNACELYRPEPDNVNTRKKSFDNLKSIIADKKRGVEKSAIDAVDTAMGVSEEEVDNDELPKEIMEPIISVEQCDALFDNINVVDEDDTIHFEIWSEDQCREATKKSCITRGVKQQIHHVDGNLMTFTTFDELVALSPREERDEESFRTMLPTEFVSHIKLKEYFKPPLSDIFNCEGSKPKPPGDQDCIAFTYETSVDDFVIMDSETTHIRSTRSCVKCKVKVSSEKLSWLYVIWDKDDSEETQEVQEGKAHIVKMIHEGDEESDDIDEGNTVELERDDEEISSNDGNEEENGKDEILCDNVKSMIQADQIVCDRRMVNTVTLKGLRTTEEQATCCGQSYSTCSDGKNVLRVDTSICPTGSCCWGNKCRKKTDSPSKGSCDYGDECCTGPVFMCRNGMGSYAHPDCPTRCCAKGCSILFSYV